MGGMNYFNLRTPDDLAIIEDAGFTLDVGHAYVNRCLADFLSAPFSHMHLHDNDGRSDTHSPVGEGRIDFSPVISAMKQKSASAVIEVKSFEGAINRLRTLDGMQGRLPPLVSRRLSKKTGKAGGAK